MIQPFYFYVFRCVRKIATISFGMVYFVSPSVRMEQLGSQWTDYHEISYISENLPKNSILIKI